MTILHVNNLCVIMGTTCHTLTMVKAYPEHRHVVAFVWENGPSAYMLAEFKSAGAEVIIGSGAVDAQLIERVDPDIVILNNERPEFIDPVIVPKLVSTRVLVSYSHDRDIVTENTFSIWNSRFTMAQHSGAARKTTTIVMGSYIDTEPFEAIVRDYEKPRVTVGMLTTGPRRFEAKLSDALITLFMRIKMRRPEVSFIVPNASMLLSLPKWCASPDYTNSGVEQFYQDVDVFVHYTKKSSSDGWGRPVTEAMASGLPVVAENRGGVVEQIKSGVDGYLADTEEEFIDYVNRLCSEPTLRRRMGTAARKKAVECFGIPAIRRTLEDVFVVAEERHQRRREHVLHREEQLK